MFRQNVWVTGTEVSKWLILITDQFNSSLLLTVTHAISPTSVLFLFFFLPCLETDRYKHTYAQGIYIIACLHRAHTTQLFSTSAVSPKSFKFPSGAYWILSKVSIGRLVLYRVTWGYMGLLAIWGQRRSMKYEWFHTINHCLLPLLPFPPPAGFTYSRLCSSLQPPASLLFWQLFLMLTDPPTDGILLYEAVLYCGFSSQPSPAFLPFPPLCLFADCHQSHLVF